MEEDYKPGSEPYAEQNERSLFCKLHYKGVLLLLIPGLLSPILLGPQVMAYRLLYLVSCVYLYYICNVMAQGAIAFMFIVFVPLMGITSSKALCIASYGDPIFCTFGSIAMGIAMDTSKLSDRLALTMLHVTGTNLRIIQIFFLVLTAFSSIFLCSTLMAAFWMKIAQAILTEYGKAGVLKLTTEEETYERQARPYPTHPVIGIYLSVAYAASLGAMASPFHELNSTIHYVLKKSMMMESKGIWHFYMLPLCFGLFVFAVWINVIFLGLLPGKAKDQMEEADAASQLIVDAIAQKKANIGRWTIDSIIVLTAICALVALLAMRELMWLSPWRGWDSHLISSNGDSVATIFFCILMFAVPANYFFCRYYICRLPDQPGTEPSLVNWKSVSINTPWAHVFMMAAANGVLLPYVESQLMDLVHGTIARNVDQKWPSHWIGAMLGTLLSNLCPAGEVATTTLQSLVDTGRRMKVGPGPLVASYASCLHNHFLLPLSTTSNTIVAGWGNVRPFEFLLGGSVPTICMLVCLVLCVGLLGNAFWEDS